MTTDRNKRLPFALDLSDPLPEFIGPRLPPCRLEDHRWTLRIEEGRAFLCCLDECSEERKLGMDTSRHGPMCDVVHEFVDGMHMEGEIVVRLVIETEHTPSTPNGPAEWDAWLVVHPLALASDEAPRPIEARADVERVERLRDALDEEDNDGGS